MHLHRSFLAYTVWLKSRLSDISLSLSRSVKIYHCIFTYSLLYSATKALDSITRQKKILENKIIKVSYFFFRKLAYTEFINTFLVSSHTTYNKPVMFTSEVIFQTPHKFRLQNYFISLKRTDTVLMKFSFLMRNEFKCASQNGRNLDFVK